jgi:hypothetical protein
MPDFVFVLFSCFKTIARDTRTVFLIQSTSHHSRAINSEDGNRNYSECAIGRYKRILGNKLHAREFVRQQQEATIGCSILNKMMCVTLGDVRSKV